VKRPLLAAPQPLAAHHRLAAFACGEPSLDDWLKRRAARNQATGASRTYVVCDGDDTVLGFYCLAAGAIGRVAAPKALQRNQPDPLPVLVLGRLAIHHTHHQQGLGTALLNDAIRRSLQAADIAGVTALLVHALSEPALRFYLSRGFTESPVRPMTLCLMLATVAQALGEAPPRRR
jgi:GNAT superfamily N-acetyltransferase